ncbi:hypothetical protein V495_07962, partial [Pseudogymnoascus sp. VKM F-4514 (FW-929)]
MPRDPYTDYAPRPTQRWDADRFASERDRDRFDDDRGPSRPSRRRSPSVDSDISSRRGPPPR